jgi:hypothetical protein
LAWRRPRSRLRAWLEKRVARDEDGPRLERLRQIARRKPETGAGIGDDRRAADNDDAARARLDVVREQRLDAGRCELVRHQPAGGVRADPTDNRGACPEARGRERRIRGGPARAQLDAAVDATAGDGLRERPIEHHVTDGNQIMRHPSRLVS